MNRFEEGLKLLEACCGNKKDNVIALSSIAIETNADGKPIPYVRDVDAYYENGVFYIVTSSKSSKAMQIAQNNEVAFAVHFEGISGNGIAENLGWVLKQENAQIRKKLRIVFEDWYEQANNEQDEGCIILAIRITKGRIFKDHGAVCYHLDFVNKTEIE